MWEYKQVRLFEDGSTYCLETKEDSTLNALAKEGWKVVHVLDKYGEFVLVLLYKPDWYTSAAESAVVEAEEVVNRVMPEVA
jgi:hypothetical protein